MNQNIIVLPGLEGWTVRGAAADRAAKELPAGVRHARLRLNTGLLPFGDEGQSVIAADRTEATLENRMALDDASFAELVNLHYESLYRFAFSLTHTEADARDLVQDTFAELGRKGHQIKTIAKAKSWLFTTLYRAFLDMHRRELRHPKVEMETVEPELPVTLPDVFDRIDSATVCEALGRVDELFRVPLILFYLEDNSYAEIAEILDVPIGTVMSRVSRGRNMLRELMAEKPGMGTGTVPAKRAL